MPPNEAQCPPCPRGFYQPQPNAMVCLECQNTRTTVDEGSVGPGQCLLQTSGGKYHREQPSDQTLGINRGHVQISLSTPERTGYTLSFGWESEAQSRESFGISAGLCVPNRLLCRKRSTLETHCFSNTDACSKHILTLTQNPTGNLQQTFVTCAWPWQRSWRPRVFNTECFCLRTALGCNRAFCNDNGNCAVDYHQLHCTCDAGMWCEHSLGAVDLSV